jgi:hypothetical protein
LQIVGGYEFYPSTVSLGIEASRDTDPLSACRVTDLGFVAQPSNLTGFGEPLQTPRVDSDREPLPYTGSSARSSRFSCHHAART